VPAPHESHCRGATGRLCPKTYSISNRISRPAADLPQRCFPHCWELRWCKSDKRIERNSQNCLPFHLLFFIVFMYSHPYSLDEKDSYNHDEDAGPDFISLKSHER
jgi:hypothetical protein